MDWRLLGSTFLLIFMAELGDKTQLTAFAYASGSRSPWSVFLGASLALVASTALAVGCATGLRRLLGPGAEMYIKLVAGVLFLVFGALLLWNALRGDGEPTAAKPGVLGRLALAAAAEFEEATVAHYIELTEKTADARARALLDRLLRDEKEHIAHLHALASGEMEAGASPSPPEFWPHAEDWSADLRALVEDVLAHEREAAAFYRELARSATLPELRAAFAWLAEEETKHIRRLEGEVPHA